MRVSDFVRHNSEILACALVFVISLAIFWFSPVHQITDSNYSMLLSQSLIEHRSFMLDSYNIPRLAPEYHDHTWKDGPIHQIELIGDHLYYYMPPGSSVLSVPYVALLNGLGISAVNADGTYNPEGETLIETSLAAFLMASLTGVFFITSRLLLSTVWSVVISLGGALGTQVWSTASRALWADTWGILLLAVVIYLLLRQEAGRDLGRRGINPIILATLLSWMYFVRPTNSVPIIAITLYLFIFYRHLFWRLFAVGGLWLLGFITYSWIHFRAPLPHYFMPGRLSFGSFLPAIAGNLVSPSRGLLVYVPVLTFVAYLAIRYRTYVSFPRLAFLSMGVIAGFILVVSGFEPWWAGASFGPRYTAPLVPCFVLLGILGVDALEKARAAHRERGSGSGFRNQLVLGGLLLVLSVSANAIGAISDDAWMWNTVGDIDHDPGKVWNWKYPQLLAPFLKPPLPSQFPVADGQINLYSAEAARFLWYGWADPETGLRWSEGSGAAIIFDLQDLEDTICEIKLTPFLVPGKLSQQVVGIDLNGEKIRSLQLTETTDPTYEIVLPARLLTHRNILTFDLPGAVSPRSFHLNNDSRRLAIAVSWIRFRPGTNKNNRQN